jgi:hypothetical protein
MPKKAVKKPVVKRVRNTFVKKSITQLRQEFSGAPDDALLDRPTTAAGIGYSFGWMELKATTGGGVPFLKVGRRCLYRKSDALAWLEANSQRVCSTSEYKTIPHA